MPINAGKMEILRDFWNTEHHRITKMEQVKQITPIPIHLDAEIKLHYQIEKLLNNYEDDNDDGHNNLSLIKNSLNSFNDSGDYDSDNNDDNEEIKW